MTRLTAPVVAVTLLIAVTGAYADMTWSSTDFPNINPPVDGSPQGSGYPCEIYAATAQYLDADMMIHVAINTNLPEAGLSASGWRDSYGSTSCGVVFEPGDLYIAYDSDGVYWDPDQVFAIGVTSHSGNMATQAYYQTGSNIGVWEAVAEGGIYRAQNDAVSDFATGTYEAYQHAIHWAAPPDADSSGIPVNELGVRPRNYDTWYPGSNTYPTFLRDYDNSVGQMGTATVSYGAEDDSHWPTIPGGPAGAYDILIDFDPSDLGIPVTTESLENLYFFWSMECGNDGVLLENAVGYVIPEPFSVVLCGSVLLGAAGYTIRRRK